MTCKLVIMNTATRTLMTNTSNTVSYLVGLLFVCVCVCVCFSICIIIVLQFVIISIFSDSWETENVIEQPNEILKCFMYNLAEEL